MTSGRAARVGGSAAAIALGAALLVGANWLGSRHWARSDWTKTRLYSLSETTRKLVGGLAKPVRITVFMDRDSRLWAPVSELLARYRELSPKIEVEYLDPKRNPARAEALVREFGIRQSTVVFRSGDRKKYVEEDKLADYDFAGAQLGRGSPEIKAFKGEEAFTSAILAVTEARTPRVYFSSGHGEGSIDSAERGRGFSDAKQMLERDNLTVAKWESLGKDSVPPDADAIVVAGPRTAFLEPEVGALEKYLAGGGRVLLMLDPVLPAPGSPPADYGLTKLLAANGVKLGNDIVVDPANALPLVGAETVFANRYGSHAIVRALSDEGLPIILPLARSVSKSDATASAPGSPTMLVETSSDGWGETSLAKLEEQVKKDPQDMAGPVSLAVAVGPTEEEKKAAKKGKLVVVGNSRFASSGALGNAGNANFFLNSVHWLTGSEKQIGIAPKTPEQASLSLTQAQVRRIGLFSIIGLPAMAVVLGIWVWYRRRD
ncbi:MAG TPA: GldG family protein [Thermoanaerobaculia bacterium]|nr:GldG family protein [Thermoanaerobaculia bacterium]